MFKRWTTGIISFVLLFTLAMPMQSKAAAGDNPEQQDQTLPLPVNQELPLPGSEGAEKDASAAGDGIMVGMIPMGTIEGYTIEPLGYAYVNVSNYMSYRADIVNGKLDLGRVTIPAGAAVNISLSVLYKNDSTGKHLLYIDNDTMTTEELTALNTWMIDEDAVEVPLDLSSLSDWTNRQLSVSYSNQFFGQTVLPSSAISIFAKPGKLELGYSGVKNRDGYLLRKTIQVAEGASLSFNTADVAAASRTHLPELPNVSIYSANSLAAYTDINNLILTKGRYNLSFYQQEEIEGGERVKSWASYFEANGEQELQLGVPQISVRYSDISTKQFYSDVTVANGDFYLSYSYEQIGNEIVNLNGFHTKMTDSQGKTIFEEDTQNGSLNHTFIPPLAAGTYDVEFSAKGFDHQLSVHKSVIIKDTSSYEGKGLVVHAENEAGQPLQEGQVFLFEKQPAGVWDANEGSNIYNTKLIYQAKASNDGTFIIPYANLLKGREYELEVNGTASDGQNEVVYHRTVSRDDQDIQLDSAGLKQVTVKSDLAHAGDSLLFSVMDDQEQLASWPGIARFGANHQTELYIQTDHKISLIAKLFDADTETGYLLTRTVAPGEQIVDLTGDTAEIQLPAGYENTKLDVNEGWGQKQFADRYMVTKGTDITASYYVESDGYRYSFSKHLGVVNGSTTLGIGHDFINRRTDTQFFSAGQLNSRVYTDYRDKLDNQLQDVSPVTVAKIADRIESTGIPFTAGIGGQKKVMTISDDQGTLIYESDDQPNAGNRAAGSSVLDYQLYDQSDQTVGDGAHTSSPLDVHFDMPNQPGSYALKLENQNFPSDVIALTGQAQVASYGGTDRQIPITLPAGYELYSLYGSAQLQQLDGDMVDVNMWVSNGELSISGVGNLIPDKKYALHVQLFLKSSDGEQVMYYNQLVLTGDQISNLQKIDAPSSVVTVAPKLRDLPSDFQVRTIQLEFPVIGFEDKRFTASINNYGYYDSFTMPKIVMNPQDFRILLSGSDGASTAYNLIRQVHVDRSTGKPTITDPGTHLLKLQDSRLFQSIDSISSSPWYSYGYYSWGTLLDKAYVSTGRQQFRIGTETSSIEEEPWQLFWTTRSSYNLQQDTVIPFTGHVDSSKSSLKIAQRMENGRVVIKAQPEFVSGDLKLEEIDVKRSGYYSSVPGIVTLRDSSQKKVYEALTYYWMDGFEISKTLADGTYSITFSQPVGPNEEAVLTNSFTVGSNPGGGSPGGGGGGGVMLPGGEDTNAEAPNSITFKAEDVPAPVNGTVTLQMKDKEIAIIPASILSGDGAKDTIELEGSHGKASLPPAVLEQLANLVGKDKLADAQITLSMKPVSDAELAGAVKSTDETDVQPAGTVYAFKLSITAKDGSPIVLSTFNEPITLTFELDADADKHLTNVYYIAEDGSLTYVPARLENGKLIAEVSHFSTYGVLELHKSFKDVSATFWAHDAIESLAAKQIVKGITPDTFAPNKTVTRAEFTSMLVHALGLTSDQSASFKDVPVNAWYASAVAAAYEHHLIKGVSADTFAPNKSITREEMAVILANALKLQHTDSSASQGVTFKDAAQISSWAVDAVGIALSNELIQGDSKGMFNPKDMATRAEAAKMLANLLKQTDR
ncbi:S-layer homology domain-containing protein [Paenibacillus sp. R14(2021)]|uniref:S-layer homology domain-containing protein n=1 Tax=Paenibacillus sp. R14(2021) TaxID=2859228 RepID=UPI001C612CDE|nr:S-layer homology domain-containing protein [Paenibacillus sp. R14(2021)]